MGARGGGRRVLLYSAFTDYELGLVRKLQMPAHLLLDALGGMLLVVSPWIFGFDERVWMPHVVLGGLLVVVAAVITNTVPGLCSVAERPADRDRRSALRGRVRAPSRVAHPRATRRRRAGVHAIPLGDGAGASSTAAQAAGRSDDPRPDVDRHRRAGGAGGRVPARPNCGSTRWRWKTSSAAASAPRSTATPATSSW